MRDKGGSAPANPIRSEFLRDVALPSRPSKAAWYAATVPGTTPSASAVASLSGSGTNGASARSLGSIGNRIVASASLATTATTNLYGQIRDLVASTVTAQNPGVDGSCVAAKLFQPDLLGPCAAFSNPLPLPGAPRR